MAGKSLPPLTKKAVDRLWAGIIIAYGQGPTGTCWEWQKGCNGEGYGAIQIDHGSRKTHRIAYKVYYGVDPEDLLVCHTCDNPKCIHPFHLFLGTDADNVRDRDNKGRNNQPSGDRHGSKTKPESVRRGDLNGFAKLTNAQVLDIRARYRPHKVTHQMLADEYGVTRFTILGIVKRQTWTHI